MDGTSPRQVWNAYERAWADVSAEERDRLLTSCVAEDCTFANNVSEGRGRQDLIAAIEAFQEQMPGGRIETREFITHHCELLASWNMVLKDGAVVLSGHNAARLDEEGKLTHIAGFWKG